MLPSTVSRVPDHTDAAINEMIRQETEHNIARSAERRTCCN